MTAGLLVGQLALVLWVVYEFAIEERRHLPAVLALAIAGFAVHAWLPMRLRMPLFLALSVASLPLVLPWQDALYVLGLGLRVCAKPNSSARTWPSGTSASGRSAWSGIVWWGSSPSR